MTGINYLFKLKFYLGTIAALRVYTDKCIRKVLIKVPGIKHPFRIRYDNFADDQIFNEVILKRSYWGIGNKDKTKRILDIGSNIGLSVISFLSEYPSAELVAVEPESENFKLLEENILPYIREDRTLYAIQKAVYSVDRELILRDSGTGSHGFRTVENGNEGRIGMIQAISINSLLNQLGWSTVDIIKIDIEGAEKELFESNTEWIGRTRYLIVETHDRFKDDSTKAVFHALEKYPYKMRVWNQNMLFSFTNK